LYKAPQNNVPKQVDDSPAPDANRGGRAPSPQRGEVEIEIRQVLEAEDFGEAFTSELQEQEARLRAQSANNSSGRMPRPCRQAA
jgi:hypothetical protein